MRLSNLPMGTVGPCARARLSQFVTPPRAGFLKNVPSHACARGIIAHETARAVWREASGTCFYG